jgi:hypothetical protein
VRIPAVVVVIAVCEGDDGKVLDRVRDACGLEEAVELLQLVVAAVVVEVSRKEVPVVLLV